MQRKPSRKFNTHLYKTPPESWHRSNIPHHQFSSIQSLNRVRFFATPWIAARQPSLSITNSQSSLKLMSIESVMPSSHLILHPLLLCLSLSQYQGIFQWVCNHFERLNPYFFYWFFHSVITGQVSSVAQSCPTLCDPMNRSTPALPVHHQLPEFTQTHVHRVGDAIQPSHPLSSPSSPAPTPSQHQSLFQWVNSSHEVAKVLEFQL